MRTHTMSEFHGPGAAVVGVGDTGNRTVAGIETETPTSFYTVASNEERYTVLEEIDDRNFVFVSGDLNEHGVPEQAGAFLRELSARRTVFLPEGTTETSEPIVEHTDLLFPVTVPAKSRPRFASAIADLFEAMLPPTVRELGYGEIQVAVGEGRVGKLSIDHIETTVEPSDLTPGFELASPDAQLLFLCTDEGCSHVAATATVREYGRLDGGDHVWDHRVHDRYWGTMHIKRFRTAEASARDRRAILTP